MQSESRTTKSLKNAFVNVFYLLLQTIVGFWSRKVFYDYLGSEVLGLSTTADSLLNFLNIAESGIGTAIAYFLYAPLNEKDTLSIRKIVALQGWIYRRIATCILVCAMLLMLSFPWIFSDIHVPLWYAYAMFGVLLFANMLGYYANYRSTLLAADQKNYLVVNATKFSTIAFNVFLILYLPYSSHPFLIFILTNLLGSIIGSIWLNYTIRKEYPWLTGVEQTGKQLLDEYPEMFEKTKQLFIHKTAGFVVYYLSPLIMYSFGTLTLIAYYGNYLSIIEKGRNIVSQAFAGTNAAIGSVVAGKDVEHMQNLFWELVDSRLFISTTIMFIFTVCTEPIIALWLSPDYLLGKPLLFLVILSSWLFLNRNVFDAYKDAFGLFHDVWAPIVESAISISVSIVGGYFFGIKGVILGSIVALMTIVYVWKPYCVFHMGFKVPFISKYIVPYLYRSLIAFVSFILLYVLTNQFEYPLNNAMALLGYSLVISVVSLVYFYIIFMLLYPGMRRFNERISSLLKVKLKR